MPVLLLHTNADPFVFIVKILCAVIVPYPALLLDVASKVSILYPLVCQGDNRG